MSIQALRAQLGTHAKDIQLNLGTVLTEDGAPDLTERRIYGCALASAYAVRDAEIVAAIRADGASVLHPEDIQAAKAAATIMAMNNLYYRCMHSVHDADLSKLPAKLRMNVIGAPGVDKVDFELMCLAVSVVNGCAMCMESHMRNVVHEGITKLGVQSCVRIASVVHGAAQALWIDTHASGA